MYLQVEIRIIDVNDNAPVFSSALYRVVISEGTDPGSNISIVTATDPDERTTINYDLENADRSLFSIDHYSGKCHGNSCVTCHGKR